MSSFPHLVPMHIDSSLVVLCHAHTVKYGVGLLFLCSLYMFRDVYAVCMP
jgi:hypothetical protein